MKKVEQRILQARNAGILNEKPPMLLIKSDLKRESEGIFLILYCLVDPEDGCVCDAKFQVIGPSFLIGALDLSCELILQKNYGALKSITQEHEIPPLLLLALDDIASQCSLLNLPKVRATPLTAAEGEPPSLVEWQNLSLQEKLKAIERVIAEDIRPYIEMDEGGIDVLELIDDKEVVIAYKGACTSCFSAIGATLSSIQSILRSKVMSELTVRPNMDQFNF